MLSGRGGSQQEDTLFSYQASTIDFDGGSYAFNRFYKQENLWEIFGQTLLNIQDAQILR